MRTGSTLLGDALSLDSKVSVYCWSVCFAEIESLMLKCAPRLSVCRTGRTPVGCDGLLMWSRMPDMLPLPAFFPISRTNVGGLSSSSLDRLFCCKLWSCICLSVPLLSVRAPSACISPPPTACLPPSPARPRRFAYSLNSFCTLPISWSSLTISFRHKSSFSPTSLLANTRLFPPF